MNHAPILTIGAGNKRGVIVDLSATISVAISGNSAPSVLGSTDPTANFAY